MIVLIEKFSKWLAFISKVVLVFSVLITVIDVIGRFFKKPIFGTYELVAFSSCIIFSLSLPYASSVKAHVSVDLIMSLLSKFPRKIFFIFHKVIALGLFLLLGLNLINSGTIMRNSGEVSALLGLPFYVAIYIAGISFLMVCLVLICDLIKILRGDYE